MITLLVLATLAVLARWYVRRRRRAAASPADAEPRARRRTGSLLMVVAVLALQTVATAPQAMAAECGEAPNPERPGSGMVGALDPAEGHGEKGSAYVDYNYAGMVWNVYETNCGPMSGITDPNSTIDTWAGNQLFNIGKNIVGATNSLHYTVLEGGLLSPLYNAVKTGAEKVYNNIYAQLFGLVALILAIMMFRNIWRGDLSAISKRALFALGGIWLAASSFAMLRYYDQIDRAIVQTTTNIQAGFVDESQNRVIRHVLPTDLHNRIVYDNWLRGEFGAPEAAQAQQFGRQLLDAQAFTWGQVRGGDDANQAVVDGKKQAYKDVSTQLGPATGYFTGEDGSRTGAGFLAFGQSVVYSLFQLLAKAAVLLAQILVRLFTLTAPLIGLVAMLHQDTLRRVGKVVGAVAFNLVVLSVLAGVHALLLQAIFGASATLSVLTQMVLAGLVTVLMFLVGRPVRRLWQMVEMSVSMVGSAVPTPQGGMFSRFRRRNEEPSRQDSFWGNVRDPDLLDEQGHPPTGAGTGGGRFRPEATVLASAQRLDHPPPGQARPAAAWSGTSAPTGGANSAGRPGLPGAGTAAMGSAGALGAANASVGSPGDYVLPATGVSRGDGVSAPTMSRSTAANTAGAGGHGGADHDDPEPFVVPSAMGAPVSERDLRHNEPVRGAPAGQSERREAPRTRSSPGYGGAAASEGVSSSQTAPQAPPPQSAPPPSAPASRQAGGQSAARRSNPEVVGGKPVFVLYRPSRGLEVRDESRDTDAVVR